MFTPKWKKEAKLLLKGAQKFVNYKRDLLDADKIGEIESREDDLKKAIKAKDQDAVKEASKQLRNACEKSLTSYQSPNALEENIEVFWVAIVIALGVRAYFVQPFRIPTGSMQPALNGIVAQPMHDIVGWEKPWIGKQAFDFVMKGRTYKDEVADQDKSITRIQDKTIFIFSRTKVYFTDGSDITISSPMSEAMKIPTIRKHLANGRGSSGKLWKDFKPGIHYKKGDPIFQGSLTSGDLVLVDKFSYHFRQPERGEAFVFNTRGIDTAGQGSQFTSQTNATHYIKRLVAVPDDTIQVDEPNLIINGTIAKEEMIQRVAKKTRVSDTEIFPGYVQARPGSHSATIMRKGESKTLKSPEDRNYREFYAFGDNSPNSLDSRYWGSVKQYNLVGPALFCLWPFTSGHWGFIE